MANRFGYRNNDLITGDSRVALEKTLELAREEYSKQTEKHLRNADSHFSQQTV